MKKVHILLTLCVLFWSGNFIVGKFIYNEIDPIQLSFFRWFCVAIILLPLLIKDFLTIYKTIKKNWLILNIYSILSVTAFNTLVYHSLEYTTATNALLINSVVPIMILLLSYIILQVKIVFKQLIGIVLSMIGVMYLLLKGDASLLFTLEFNVGDILVLLSGLSWALYSVLIKFKPQNIKPMNFLVILVYLGLFWLYIIYIVMGYSFINDVPLVKEYFFVFFYISVFASILSFIFWNKGVEEIGANKTGQFTHLMPIFGSILAILFLGETLFLYHFIGAGIIGFGIYLSLFSK